MLHNIRLYSFFLISAALILIFTIILSVTTFAHESSDKNAVYSKAIMLNGSCHQLVVWGDIEIVLTPSLSDSIVVEGSATDIKMIETKMKKGRLAVRAQWVNESHTTRIIVPAAMLKFIQVYGNATIHSAGFLSIPQLKIEMNGEGRIKIRSYGIVKVEPGEGYYLTEEGTGLAMSSKARILTRADFFYQESFEAAR